MPVIYTLKQNRPWIRAHRHVELASVRSAPRFDESSRKNTFTDLKGHFQRLYQLARGNTEKGIGFYGSSHRSDFARFVILQCL